MNKNKGMTILESVIAIGIFAVLTMASMTAFISLLNAQKKTSIAQETQQSGRESIDIISKLLRNASAVGLVSPTGNPPTSNAITFEVTGISSGTIGVCSVAGFNGALCINGTPITPYERIIISDLRFTQSGNVVKIDLSIRQRSDAARIFEEDTTRLETSIVLERLGR